MNNKEGKTFKDIFDSNREEESTTTFDSIFNQVRDEEENNDKVLDVYTVKEEQKIEFPSKEEDTQLDQSMFFGDSKEDTTNENLFFNDITEKNEDSIIEEDKDILKTNLNENLFFNNQESNNENELDSGDMNIFNNKTEENLFFEETTTNSEIKTLLDSKETEKAPEVINQNEKSPFFEADIGDNNDILLNNLNLVENKNSEFQNININLDKSQNYNVKIVKKKEPIGKFILGVLSYAIFIWLLLIGITLLAYVLDIKIRAAKGDYSNPKYNAYVVLTGSMLPEIKVKDVVVTKKVNEDTLKEGDVITFKSADSRFLGTIITHRIIKKTYDAETKKYSFQTKGDYNNVADSAMVPSENIFGKVVLKIPKLGYLQDFLASKGGWIIVILFPCLAVMSYDIVKLVKGLKKKKLKGIKVQSR